MACPDDPGAPERPDPAAAGSAPLLPDDPAPADPVEPLHTLADDIDTAARHAVSEADDESRSGTTGGRDQDPHADPDSEPDPDQDPHADPDSEPDSDPDPAAPPGDDRAELRGVSQLVRSSSIVGAGTLLSRISGLVRTVAIAAVLGAHTLADGYNLANTTPNMIYDLLLGGVFTATLVPVFVDHHVHRDDEGDSAVITVLVTGLIVLTAVAMVAAPWIFGLYTWNIDSSAERAAIIDVGVPLLRWFLPQILFYGLTALASAMLNARRSYLAPAFVPALNNVVVLCFLAAFWRVGGVAPSSAEVLGDPVLLVLLGGGTTAGIVVMAVALWPALVRAGIRLRPRFDWRHRSIRQVFRLSGWTLAYTLANQVALAVVLALAASIEGSGHVTAYTYAFMFFQLPNGLFAVSLMTTTEPEMARAVTAGDTAGLRRQFASGLRLVLLVLIPASAAMAVLAHPVVNALLGHGGYRDDTALTGTLLMLFSLGLVGYSVYLYALRCFYAQKNTRTPFFINLVENTINVVLAFALVGRWGAEGLVVAFSLAYSVAAVLALVAVRRTTEGIEGRVVWNTTWRTLVATALMATVGAAVTVTMGTPPGFGSLPVLVVAGGVIGGVFLVAAWRLRIPDIDTALDRFRRRSTG